MDFGIDDINRPVIMVGHKAIINPRDFDYVDFPTTSTAPPNYGTTAYYRYWDLYRESSANVGFSYYKQNDKRLYIRGVSTGNFLTGDLVLKTNRNVKHTMIAISAYLDLDSDADSVSCSYAFSLVKPDNTNLLTLSSKSNGEYSGHRLVTLALFIWWEGDVCNVLRFEGDYKYEGAYGDAYINGNTTLTQTITDADVRLKFRSTIYEGDTGNTGYFTAYLNNALIG